MGQETVGARQAGCLLLPWGGGAWLHSSCDFCEAFACSFYVPGPRTHRLPDSTVSGYKVH